MLRNAELTSVGLGKPQIPASSASATPQPVAVQVVGVPTIEVRPAGGFLYIKSETPSVWSQPSTWISVIALTTSVLGLGLTVWDKWWGYRKDGRAREQSIQDEFWLRKVLFPTAIEPAMTFVTEVIAQLPAANSTAAERLAYFADFQNSHRERARKLILVGTIWPNVYTTLESAFEEIEDAVADYCNLSDTATEISTSRVAVNYALNGSLSKFYVTIRDHQNTIGKASRAGRWPPKFWRRPL